MKTLLEKFFGKSAKGIVTKDNLMTGYADVAGQEVCVFGTCKGTYIDNAAALRLASHVIDCIENHRTLRSSCSWTARGRNPTAPPRCSGWPAILGTS